MLKRDFRQNGEERTESVYLFELKRTGIQSMKDGSQKLKPRPLNGRSTRENLRRKFPNSVRDQEKKDGGHGDLNRFEVVDLAECSAMPQRSVDGSEELTYLV